VLRQKELERLCNKFTGKHPEMSWGKFQRLLKEVGYKQPVKAGSVQLLDPEIAEAITRRWAAAAKT
jgi:hypothetical protein